MDPPVLLIERNMKETVKRDYAEIYRTREKNLLSERVKKSRLSLQLSGIIIFSGGILFKIISPAFSYLNLLLYIVVSALFLLLSVYGYKRPYKAIQLSILLLVGFGLADSYFQHEEFLLPSNIIRLISLAILVFVFKTAKEADIIKKDLHLS